MPDWSGVLKEIQLEQAEAVRLGQGAVDTVRRRYLKKLYEKTERNVIAYYSGFLSKGGIVGLGIGDEDKNGFMMAVHNLDRDKGLDLILHTPGGSIAATESIVDYLHKMFRKDIRAIIPQIAMSAGTMLACSCKEIIMSRHSNIGPIDPQLNDVPCHGVIQEFRRAWREVKKDPAKAPVWQAIIGQYRPTFLSQCENAIKWSSDFVTKELESVMFEGHPKARELAANIVTTLTDYRGNKSHSRHIHYEECKEMGLEVSLLEDDNDLQDLVLTVHHAYMHSLMNTPSYKMIENHLGIALVKQQQQTQFMQIN